MNKCNRRSWVESWHCLKSPDCTIGMTDGQPGGILRPVAALLAKLTRPLQASGCVFLSLEKARSRHSGRAASDLLIPARTASGPEFSDFRYHLQQIEIGVVEPGQLHWMEAMKFASSKHWRAPPETESPLSNPTTYDGVRSLW